jgi:hypothetical protein
MCLPGSLCGRPGCDASIEVSRSRCFVGGRQHGAGMVLSASGAGCILYWLSGENKALPGVKVP